MKSVILASCLLPALALSTPVDTSQTVTETEVDVSTVTITASNGQQTGHAAKYWAGGGTFHISESFSTNQTSTSPYVVPTATHVATASSISSIPTVGGVGAGATPSAGSGGSAYAQDILVQHNNHRANHSVGQLEWSTDLANIAQAIAETCVYAHNTQTGGGGYGQNIGAGAPPDAVPALITNDMYNNEIGFFPLPYGQASPNMDQFENWGHFSQVVWNGTSQVGCYTQACTGGLANTGSDVSPYFTVCNYKPPGNVVGAFDANVLAPKGDPTVQA